jgi:hypothetical protein
MYCHVIERERFVEVAMTTHLRLIIVALTIVLNAVETLARAETIDELYATAKKEGALSLMGGGPADSTSHG